MLGIKLHALMIFITRFTSMIQNNTFLQECGNLGQLKCERRQMLVRFVYRRRSNGIFVVLCG